MTQDAKRVLIAEDELMTRTVIANIVGKGGFEIVTASNGREAWEIIQSDRPPAVAILDWMMPEMTGVELCRKVKQQEGRPYVYLILLTSKGAKEDVVEGLDAGADDFLTKPANPNELRSRLAVGMRTVDYERALEQKNRELMIFRQAFDSSVQEITILDPERRIMHANPACLQKYGYSLEELIGSHISILRETTEGYIQNGIPEIDHDRIYAEITGRIQDPEQGHWRGMVLNRTRNGETVWADLSVNGIRTANAQLLAFVAFPVDITDRLQQEFRIRLECYNALSALAEARDNETGLHLKRMSAYARSLAHEFGMPRKYVQDIGNFAPLHDIGKVGISDDILLAPRKLTNEEFETMKTHAVIGYSILKDRPTLEMAAEIAFTHHEKFNGKGYPRGIAGADIPLSGRIVAILDVYDALRSQRPYKAPWPHEKARQTILQESGQHFDPDVVAAFERIHETLAALHDESADAPIPRID